MELGLFILLIILFSSLFIITSMSLFWNNSTFMMYKVKNRIAIILILILFFAFNIIFCNLNKTLHHNYYNHINNTCYTK